MGHTIEGGGFAQVDQALDILARHPATANHISQQLATFFVSDTPPPALVLRMTQTFQKTDGDIASVLGLMFRSVEFNASLKSKYKDPMQFVLSAVRLAYDDKVIMNAGPILGWLGRLAQGLYGRETPDGYPLTSAAWNGPGQVAVRFEIARQIGSNSAGLFKPASPGGVDPSGVSADRQRTLLQQHAKNAERHDPGGARSGDLAAGLEHPVSVVPRIHALRR